jgi:hypothetical protein
MPPTPRRLTTHQKAVLIQVLLAFPDQHVSVCYDPSATDALPYAEDFLTLFRVLGWKVEAGAPSNLLNCSNVQPSSLAFLVSAPSSLPPSAEALRDALRIYGIEVATLLDPARNVASGGFVLAIGPAASESASLD